MMRKSPLPHDMLTLLEVAAGDGSVIGEVTRTTGRGETQLRHAASFFVEQILLSENADSFRVLGGDDTTPIEVLRKHMALLMRWSHPDVARVHGAIDRSIYAGRVTRAWNALKTELRRARSFRIGGLPDAARGAEPAQGPANRNGGAGKLRRPVRRVRAKKGQTLFATSRRQASPGMASAHRSSKSHKRKRLSLFRLEGEGVVTWLLRLWQRV